jgi:hypothetical protein
MSDQQVKYTITADATQANAELAKIDKAAVSLVGNEQKLATETNKATAAIKEQGKAATTTAAATQTLQQRIGKAAEGLSKQAAAISLVSSSMEGMGGQVGKMVAGAGQMAAAFGAGGPFALALVAGLAAVDAFSSHLASLNREQDDLIAKTYGPVEAVAGQMQKAERDLAALRRDAAGPETVKQAAARVQAEIDAVNVQVADVIKARNAMKVSAEEEYFAERNRFEQQRKILEKTVTLLEQKQLLETGKAAAGLPTKKIGLAAVSPEAMEESETFEKSRIWLQSMRDDAIAHRLKNEADAREELARIDEKAAKETERINEKAARETQRMDAEATAQSQRQADDRVKIAQEEARLKMEAAQQNAMYATQALGIVGSATQQYLTMRIQGEKNAEQAFAASIMGQAGQALVSYGVQAFGRGVLEASSPVTAVLAPASFAASAALIGGGLALGGVATGLTHAAAGGKVGSEIPDKEAAKDKGASPGGRGGGGGGGGSLVVNVSYGAGGPLPEDTAREIAKVTNTGRRRGAA